MYKIQNEYVAGQFSGRVIVRYDATSTTSFIEDPANTDYQQYLQWLGDGNVPVTSEGNAPQPADQGEQQ